MPASTLITVPSAIFPDRRSDLGPSTPVRIGTCPSTGWVGVTELNVNCLPRRSTVSPASRARTPLTHSVSADSGDFAVSPIWSVQKGTPCPMPGRNRPGWARASVAISIAVTAGWRATEATTPRPTFTRSVAPRARAVPVKPP